MHGANIDWGVKRCGTANMTDIVICYDQTKNETHYIDNAPIIRHTVTSVWAETVVLQMY